MILLLDLIRKCLYGFVPDKLSEGFGVWVVFSPMKVESKPIAVQCDLVLVYPYLRLNEVYLTMAKASIELRCIAPRDDDSSLRLAIGTRNRIGFEFMR